MGHFIDLPKIAHPDFAVPGQNPVGPVEIDLSHPLAEGLSLAITAQHGVLHGSVSIELQGSFTRFPYRGEMVWGHNSSTTTRTDYLDITGSAIPDTSAPYTVLFRAARAQPIVGSTVAGLIDMSSTSNGNEINYGNGFGAAADDHKPRHSTNSGTPDIFISGQDPSGHNPAAYTIETGRFYNILSLHTYNAAANRWSINRGSTASFTVPVYVSVHYAWSRHLSDAEALSITRDPYQIIKPATTLQFYVPSAGGSTPKTIGSSFDAYVQKQNSLAASADALLQKNITATAGLDAAIQQVKAATTDLDALLQGGVISGSDLDALLQAAKSAAASLDAEVAKAMQSDASVDALLQKLAQSAASLDALVQKSVTAVVSADAHVQGTRSAGASLDAILILAGTTMITASLDALLQAQGITATVSLDAYLQQSKNNTANADALVQAQANAAATVDAYLQAQGFATAGMDALLQSGGHAASASADAWVQKALAVSASLDAVLAIARALTATADAYVQKPIGVGASLDAILTGGTSPPFILGDLLTLAARPTHVTVAARPTTIKIK